MVGDEMHSSHSAADSLHVTAAQVVNEQALQMIRQTRSALEALANLDITSSPQEAAQEHVALIRLHHARLRRNVEAGQMVLEVSDRLSRLAVLQALEERYVRESQPADGTVGDQS